MEITGKFIKKSDVKTFESGFQVQEFYLDCKKFNPNTGEPIENLLKFQMSGSKIETLNSLKKGDNVKVLFSIQGRLFDKKDGSGKAHVQNLDAWKFEVVQDQVSSTQTTALQQQVQSSNEEEEDLPF